MAARVSTRKFLGPGRPLLRSSPIDRHRLAVLAPASGLPVERREACRAGGRAQWAKLERGVLLRPRKIPGNDRRLETPRAQTDRKKAVDY